MYNLLIFILSFIIALTGILTYERNKSDFPLTTKSANRIIKTQIISIIILTVILIVSKPPPEVSNEPRFWWDIFFLWAYIPLMFLTSITIVLAIVKNTALLKCCLIIISIYSLYVIWLFGVSIPSLIISIISYALIEEVLPKHISVS